MIKIQSMLSALVLASAATIAFAVEWKPLPETIPVPADNPMTKPKIALGKKLYFDPRLSSTGTVSCNSCHNVMLGGDDIRAVAVGVHGQLGGRSAPTVWNAAFNSVQFWDGRAESLEEQAKGPVVNPIEMGMASWDDVIERLRSIEGYEKEFKAVFGGEEPITLDNIAKAIAAYERTLITPNSPYDRYVKGDKNALTEQQIRGMQTFAEAGCNGCHSGPVFNGPSLPQGQGFFMKFPTYDNGYLEAQYGFKKDKGRYDVTGKEEDMHMFKVPILRNAALTAPYFHNGSVKTLDRAVRVMAKLQLNKDLSDQQVADIVAFLTALTGEFPEQEMPRLPPTYGRSFDLK